MRRFNRIFKVILASVLMTLMFSCSASSLAGKNFIATDIIEVIVKSAHNLDTQVKGFGRRGGGFGMNFGGSGKNTATNNSTPKNTATKNTNAQNQSTPPRRPGFWGFLAGLGMFSWLLLGAGLLGGGFLIYLIAMLVIPMIVAALASKRKSASDDLPSSSYSSSELFKDHSQDKDKRQF